MSGRRKLLKAVDKTQLIKQDYQEEISALLGVTKDGQKLVNVPDRPGYVYARIRGNLSELVQAFNDQVTGVYDLPVLLVRDYIDKGRFRVRSRDLGKYENWGSVSYVPRHAETHLEANNDPVYITSNQILNFRVVPTDMKIQIWRGELFGNNFETPGRIAYWDLSPYIPVSGSCWELIYLDRLGDFYRKESVIVDTISLLTPEHIPFCPFGAWPIAAIRLYAGQTAINPASDMINLRWAVLPYNCAVGAGGQYPDYGAVIATGTIMAASQNTGLYSESGGTGTTDELDTIYGGAPGSLLFLSAPTSAITVKNNTGNILLTGGDFVLDSADKVLLLIYNNVIGKWLKVS